MSEKLRNLTIAVVMIASVALLAVTVSTRPVVEDRVQQIGALIKCPVCQGESIADSPSQMARDMVALVTERVESGVSDQAIIDELLASYSGAVLLDPPVSGNTLLLWLAPLVALAIGVAVILRWRQKRDTPLTDNGAPTSRRRVFIGGLALLASFAVIVVIAGSALQERDGTSSGVAAIEGDELSDVSNETMEAVIAANADHPQVNGMRLALADRYYQAGDYSAAFPHYLAVAESDIASRPEMVTSLVRLGWMAYEGNGATDTALRLFDEALEIDSSSQMARFLKGTVLWCGSGQAEEAASIFASLLDDPDLAEVSRDRIQDDHDAASAGEVCV